MTNASPFVKAPAMAVAWHGDAKDSIEPWADQLAEPGDAPRDRKVEDASNFTLKPW